MGSVAKSGFGLCCGVISNVAQVHNDQLPDGQLTQITLGQLVRGQQVFWYHLSQGSLENWDQLLKGTVGQGRLKVISQVVTVCVVAVSSLLRLSYNRMFPLMQWQIISVNGVIVTPNEDSLRFLTCCYGSFRLNIAEDSFCTVLLWKVIFAHAVMVSYS